VEYLFTIQHENNGNATFSDSVSIQIMLVRQNSVKPTDSAEAFLLSSSQYYSSTWAVMSSFVPGENISIYLSIYLYLWNIYIFEIGKAKISICFTLPTLWCLHLKGSLLCAEILWVKNYVRWYLFLIAAVTLSCSVTHQAKCYWIMSTYNVESTFWIFQYFFFLELLGCNL